MSKKVVLSADGATATVSEAVLSDVFTSVLSTDTFVSGTYGFLQKGALFLGGMVAQEYRRSGKLNPL